MNQGQEKFYNFIMENIEEENKQQAKELLSESFAKQNDGTFNSEYMKIFIPRMMKLIKEDSVDKVKSIMINHKA